MPFTDVSQHATGRGPHDRAGHLGRGRGGRRRIRLLLPKVCAAARFRVAIVVFARSFRSSGLCAECLVVWIVTVLQPIPRCCSPPVYPYSFTQQSRVLPGNPPHALRARMSCLLVPYARCGSCVASTSTPQRAVRHVHRCLLFTRGWLPRAGVGPRVAGACGERAAGVDAGWLHHAVRGLPHGRGPQRCVVVSIVDVCTSHAPQAPDRSWAIAMARRNPTSGCRTTRLAATTC